jgi:hypothetical protein
MFGKAFMEIGTYGSSGSLLQSAGKFSVYFHAPT